MKIAWFSLFNNNLETQSEYSLGGYLSVAVLPELSKSHQIDLFHDSFESEKSFAGKIFEVNHYLRYSEINKARNYDLCIHNIEDLKKAFFTRVSSNLHTGLSIFHQIYFKNRSMISNAEIDPFYDEHLVKRELKKTGVPVFMNSFFKKEYDQQYKYISSIKSYELDYPASIIATQSNSLLSAEEALSSPMKITIIGTNSPKDRIYKLLPVIAESLTHVKVNWITDDKNSAEKFLMQTGIKNYNIINLISPQSLIDVINETDVVFYLKCSEYGNLAPYISISISNNKPIVIMNRYDGELINEELVIKIDSTESEATQINSCLDILKENYKKLRNFTSQNRDQRFDVKTVAERLNTIILDSAEYVQNLKSKNEINLKTAKKSVRDDFIENISMQTPGSLKNKLNLFEDAELFKQIL